MPDRQSSNGPVDLQSLDEDGLGDEPEGGDLLDDAIIGRLVEDDSVLGFVLYFSLGPFLFLCGLAPG